MSQWIVEQRHVSKMGEERWLKVEGPFSGEEAIRTKQRFSSLRGVNSRELRVRPIPETRNT